MSLHKSSKFPKIMLLSTNFNLIESSHRREPVDFAIASMHKSFLFQRDKIVRKCPSGIYVIPSWVDQLFYPSSVCNCHFLYFFFHLLPSTCSALAQDSMQDLAVWSRDPCQFCHIDNLYQIDKHFWYLLKATPSLIIFGLNGSLLQYFGGEKQGKW